MHLGEKNEMVRLSINTLRVGQKSAVDII